MPVERVRRQRRAPERYDPGDDRRWNQVDLDRMRRQERRRAAVSAEEEAKKKLKEVAMSRTVSYCLYEYF